MKPIVLLLARNFLNFLSRNTNYETRKLTQNSDCFNTGKTTLAELPITQNILFLHLCAAVLFR